MQLFMNARAVANSVGRFGVLALLALPATTIAAEPITISAESINIMWIMVGAILVFFMQAGFALLESGMSRAKNAVNVMMKNYVDVCLGSLVFWLVGFGLMFGDNASGFYGFSNFAMSEGTPWDYAVMIFQIMFAATAITICSGAMAERTRYASYLIAVVVMTAFIYPIFGSWVWGGMYGGGGWLSQLGFIDFAGSTVVHSIGAWCALAGIIVLGARTGRFDRRTGEARRISGHNLGLVTLGGFILWLGWFGFNGASTLSVDADLGLIILNTQLSASAGVVGSLFYSIIARKPILLTAAVNGSVAGLVGITAGAASMLPIYAILTGFIAGIVATYGAGWLERRQLDDVVGAIPVHGFAGVWGTLAAGLFLKDNMFDMYQLAVQVIGVFAAFFWAFPTALIAFFIIDRVVGLRVTTEDEQRGLDYAEHDEIGYPEFHQHVTYHRE